MIHSGVLHIQSPGLGYRSASLPWPGADPQTLGAFGFLLALTQAAETTADAGEAGALLDRAAQHLDSLRYQGMTL